MKTYLITQLIKALFAMLSPAMLEELADKIIDFAENKATAMPEGDSWRSIVEGICANIRTAFNIEDND